MNNKDANFQSYKYYPKSLQKRFSEGGLRLKDNNSNATLYDISDDLTYNEKENYTLAHFRERINIYSGEDFDYEIHNIELNNAENNR